MNILIDGRPFVAPSAGITNFLKGSLTAWAIQRPHDEFMVAMPHERHATLDMTDIPDNIRFISYTNQLLRRLPNLLWLCLTFPLLSRSLKADAYYSALPCLPFLLPRRMKKMIVVHDVVNLEFKETMQWTNVLSNKLFFNRSVRKADIIWANSNYTRAKVEQYFPQRRCQDLFTGCAVNRSIYHALPLSDSEKADIREKHGIEGRFILFVGSLEPRKNLSFLLSLMPELYGRHQIQLVVVGGHGWKNSSVSQLVNAADFPKESTVFCGFITNEELASLYNLADCFVSTSLNEGFGMPQLEAMQCGCPVVTAHNSAMIEVAEGKSGAITVEGYNPQDWIDAICKTIANRPVVDQQQLTEYDWNQIVDRLIPRLYRP